MKQKLSSRLLLACALLLALAACKKPAPAPPPAASTPTVVAFRVTSIDLGKSVGADKRIAQPVTTFGPRDTIYASVVTEGAASAAVITARWSFQDGQLVNEMSESISPTGPAATEFHITKGSPWPAGNYAVEVSVNGAPSGRKDFTVTN